MNKVLKGKYYTVSFLNKNLDRLAYHSCPKSVYSEYLDSMFYHVMNAKLYFCACWEIVVGSSDKPICPGPFELHGWIISSINIHNLSTYTSNKQKPMDLNSACAEPACKMYMEIYDLDYFCCH